MMLPAFRYLLGSSMGQRQAVDVLDHQEDLCSIFSFLLNNREISGPVNVWPQTPSEIRVRENPG